MLTVSLFGLGVLLCAAIRTPSSSAATTTPAVRPPSQWASEVEAVREWLRLFDERGQKLYAGIEQLESGGILDRLKSAFAMSEYGDDTDLVLAKAKQLGVESRP